MYLRKRWVYISILLSVLFLSSCSISEKKEIKDQGIRLETRREKNKNVKEMVVAMNLDGSTSNIFIESAWFNRNRLIGGLLFQGLMIAEDNMNNVQMDLCSEYSISPDGLSYVFLLQDNLYWHDGTKLTMDDVVWSIKTCLKAQNVNGYLKKILQRIDGASEYVNGTSDELTGLRIEGEYLVLKISQRDDSFLSGLAQLAILPRHCFEGVEPDDIEISEFWKSPIGSGPYKIKEVKEGKEILFEVNETYHGKLPQIQRIRCVLLENPGEDKFDFAMTSDPDIIQKYMAHPEYEVVQTKNLYYRYLMFNVDGRSGTMGEMLKNKRIRQALYLGLDRRTMIEEIYGQAAIQIDTGIDKESFWHVEEASSLVDYDPEAAKEILLEEGFSCKEPLVLTRYSEDELSVELLEKVADCWRKLGLEVVIEPIDSSQINRMWVDTDWYNVALKNLAAVDYSEWYYEYSSSNQLWSQVLKNRTEFDSLVNYLNGSNWAYERREIYRKLQEMELEYVYKIPLAIVPQYVIYNRRNLDIPEMEFPNLWYYFDIHIEDWNFRQ